MDFSNNKKDIQIFHEEYEMKSLEELEKLVGNDEIKEYLEKNKYLISMKKDYRPRFRNMYKSELISILWSRKTKFFHEFFSIMFLELKKDYINKYGIEKYIIEEESIKKEIKDIINKKKEMLLRWDDTIID